MGIFGTFIKGAISGIIGPGALSWLHTTVISDRED